MMEQQPKKQGGARPGAGRPKGHNRQVSYWLSPEQKEKTDEFVKNLKKHL